MAVLTPKSGIADAVLKYVSNGGRTMTAVTANGITILRTTTGSS